MDIRHLLNAVNSIAGGDTSYLNTGPLSPSQSNDPSPFTSPASQSLPKQFNMQQPHSMANQTSFFPFARHHALASASSNSTGASAASAPGYYTERRASTSSTSEFHVSPTDLYRKRSQSLPRSDVLHEAFQNDNNEAPPADDIDVLIQACHRNRNAVKGIRDAAMVTILLEYELSAQAVADLRYKDVQVLVENELKLDSSTGRSAPTSPLKFNPRRDHPPIPKRAPTLLKKWLNVSMSHFGWNWEADAPVFVPLVFHTALRKADRVSLKRDAVSKTFQSLKSQTGIKVDHGRGSSHLAKR